MQKIDSHQHFWKFDPVRDSWIDDGMKVIQKDFLPGDLYPVLKQNNIQGCVVVQSDQTEIENDFQLKNAKENDFIKGVVGWVDLQTPAIENRLEYYAQFSKLKGFRHVLQAEPDRDFMLKPAFLNGIRALKKHNFTYDILIFADQLTYANSFVKACPNQKFVLDHIAKPPIKSGEINTWAKDIRHLAENENVWCKVSGMITEADWFNWLPQNFTPYLEVIFEAFGTNRVMFGSDWPVCNVAGGYATTITILEPIINKLSENEQEQFWGLNAIEFYNL